MFSHIIEPILEEKCQSCHNPSKIQGELDLTSIEGIEKGGLSGHAVEEGKLNKSEIYKRVTLPKESKKYMPPGNRLGFTNVELDLLKTWIENGASYEMKFHDLHPNENERYLVSVYLGMSDAKNNENQLPDVTDINEHLLQELIAEGLMIDYVADKSALIDVSFVNVAQGKVSDLLNKLSGIAVNIYKINLSNCGLEDKDMESIKTMTNLHFLRLENNKPTGASITSLVALKQLEYLNLNGNPLDESAKEGLEQLNFVDKIYLWQTDFDHLQKSNILTL